MEKGAHVAEPDAPEPVAADPQAAPAFPTAGAASREGVLFVQRHAGNAAAGRLLRATRVLARKVVPEGSPGKRTNVEMGDTGPGVKLVQRMLGVPETGTFDQVTRNALDRFQKMQGWDPSGIGPLTWAALDNHEGTPGNRPNLVEGDRGPAVKLLQHILGVKETSYFGTLTRKAVDAFQKKQGWTPSGVGPMTWAALDTERPRVEVADRMGAMTDPASPTRAVWHPSGNDPDSTDFSSWALAATEDTKFSVSPTTVINCWEMVLYSAWKQGAISWSWIHTVYSWSGAHSWYKELAIRLVRGSAWTWDRATKKPRAAARRHRDVRRRGARRARHRRDRCGGHARVLVLAGAGCRVRCGRLRPARQGEGRRGRHARQGQGHDDRAAGRGDGHEEARHRGHGRTAVLVATAKPLATIPWAPEGPLPHRLVPVRLSSMASDSGGPLHPAASRVRTLSGGAVCVLGVAEEGSGRHAAVRVEADGSLPRARVGGARDRRAGLGDRRLPRRGRRQLDGAGAGPRPARPGPGARDRAGRDDAVAGGGDGRLGRGAAPVTRGVAARA